jgi:hypothetical protein
LLSRGGAGSLLQKSNKAACSPRSRRTSRPRFAISKRDVEDPVVFKRLIRGFEFSRSDADDKDPVSLRYEFRRRGVCHFNLFGRLLDRSLQSRVSAVRAGQRRGGERRPKKKRRMPARRFPPQIWHTSRCFRAATAGSVSKAFRNR